MPMFRRKPRRAIDGKVSFNSSTRLPDSSVTNALKPVTLPPGWARRAAGHDEVDAAADQVGHERGKPITVPIGRAIFDLQVLPFYIAVLVKAAQQRVEIRLVTTWR